MKLSSSVLASLLAFGCASGPSKQLVSARQTYAEVSSSDAVRTAPASVWEAQKSLERAEGAHDEDPASFREKSLAYVAERKAQLAASTAELYAARERIASAEKNYMALQDQLRTRARDALGETRDRLRDVRQQLAAVKDNVSERAQQLRQKQAELEKRERELEQARNARLAAEKKLADAKARLEEVATMRQEPQRVVITLDGAVLFKTGEANLLPTARAKLDRVADMLKLREGTDAVVIEGHTDAQGDDASNLELSRRRASAVRDYLTTRGIAREQLQAVGRGEENPIASNETVEGRANNRRVEISMPRSQSSTGAEQQPASGNEPTSSASQRTGTQ